MSFEGDGVPEEEMPDDGMLLASPGFRDSKNRRKLNPKNQGVPGMESESGTQRGMDAISNPHAARGTLRSIGLKEGQTRETIIKEDLVTMTSNIISALDKIVQESEDRKNGQA